MPAWEDLSAFLDPADFGELALVRLQAGGTRQFACIFDDPYLNAQLGEYEMDTARPRLTARAADLVGIQRGDEVDVHGKTYDVLSGPQDDGTGMSMLSMAARA